MSRLGCYYLPMIYRFESFELDTDRFELRQDGNAVPVEPQGLALLTLLVANSERVVSKDELIEKIWNGRIVSESAISSRVKRAKRECVRALYGQDSWSVLRDRHDHSVQYDHNRSGHRFSGC